VQTMKASRILTQASRVEGGGVRGAVSTAQWQTHTWLAGSRHWGRMMMGWVCGEARSRTTASHLRCLRGPQVPRTSSQACLALSPPTAARHVFGGVLIDPEEPCPASRGCLSSFPQASARLHARQTIMRALGKAMSSSSRHAEQLAAAADMVLTARNHDTARHCESLQSTPARPRKLVIQCIVPVLHTVDSERTSAATPQVLLPEALTPYKGARDPYALWLDKVRVAPASPRSWPRGVLADRLLVLPVHPYYPHTPHTARRIQTYRNTCCPTNRRSQRSKQKAPRNNYNVHVPNQAWPCPITERPRDHCRPFPLGTSLTACEQTV
jgi:hypothetical protein